MNNQKNKNLELENKNVVFLLQALCQPIHSKERKKSTHFRVNNQLIRRKESNLIRIYSNGGIK